MRPTRIAVVFACLVGLLLTVALAGCGAGASGSAAAPSTPAQLGERVFRTGNGANGSAVGVSAGASGPCQRCHGPNAQGAMGPDIRWSVLTGATSSSHAPRFPLADEAQFATAVTTGVANGNQLKAMMPHFNLTPAETAGLVAYLKTL